MIENTRQFKRKSSVEVAEPLPAVAIEENVCSEDLKKDITQPDMKNDEGKPQDYSRRDWFQQLIPSFGSSLVKVLRESNQLKHQIKEKLNENKNSSF